MSTKEPLGDSESRRKRRRSNKPDDGPARQRRKVSRSGSSPGKAASVVEPHAQSPESLSVTVQAVSGSLAVQVNGSSSKRRRKQRLDPDDASTGIVTAASAESKPRVSSEPGSWNLGNRLGGRYIRHDPLFSQDGQYLIAAYPHCIRVLSLESSLLERTITRPEGEIIHDHDYTIVSFALSLSNPSYLYVVYNSLPGLYCWDWTNGTLADHILVDSHHITSIAVANQPGSSDRDIIWTVQQHSSESFIALDGRKVLSLLDLSGPIHNLSAKENNVLASSGTTLIVGTIDSTAKNGKCDSSRTSFVEYVTTTEITCVAARQNTPSAASQKRAKAPRQSMNIAVGNMNGEIFLYDHVSAANDAKLPTPRTLHWHRDAVGCLKWSKDGNYLVSGGLETVLVLWQLSTGRQQFLPHLAAEIECVTVSPDGAAYAIQLADNSIMVLSTTELIPVANFAGLQAIATYRPAVVPSKTMDNVMDGVGQHRQIMSSAAAIHPVHDNQLVVAVPPSSLHGQKSSRPAPFLQTYDLSYDRHMARQALSRNKLTDLSTGPEGNVIREPNVTLLQLSHDGDWMATVEEWAPPMYDTSYLAANDSVNKEQNTLRAEVYLKFWRWSAQKNTYTLDTRIDNPHPRGQGESPGRILDLVSDPQDTSFATIGQDASVRIWRPQMRRQNGMVVQAEGKIAQTEWKAKRVISFEKTWEQAECNDLHGSLAYSFDGSLLAASIAPRVIAGPSPVHFIQVSSGATLEPQSGIYTGRLITMRFLGRQLVIVSNTSLSIFDVVIGALVHRIRLHDELELHGSSRAIRPRVRMLCTSESEARIAAAIPTERNGRQATRVLIFSPVAPYQKLFDQTIDEVVTALMHSAGGKSGFTLLLSSAEILTLGQTPGSVSQRLIEQGMSVVVTDAAGPIGAPEVNDQDADSDDDMVIDEPGADPGGDSAFGDAGFASNHETRIVRAEQLGEIFDGANGQGTLNMPVEAMFDAVVGLFARKVVV